MTDEAKLIIAGLRYCVSHDLCDECPAANICRFSDTLIEAKAADLIEALAAELEQAKRERDAAIDDIPHCCYYCKQSADCALPSVYDDSTCAFFQWRGPKEDNSAQC